MSRNLTSKYSHFQARRQPTGVGGTQRQRWKRGRPTLNIHDSPVPPTIHRLARPNSISIIVNSPLFHLPFHPYYPPPAFPPQRPRSLPFDPLPAYVTIFLLFNLCLHLSSASNFSSNFFPWGFPTFSIASSVVSLLRGGMTRTRGGL